MPKRVKADNFNNPGHSWAVTYKIGKVITSNFNLEDSLSLIGKVACSVTKSDASSITIVDTETAGLYIGGTFGINKSEVNSRPFEFETAIARRLAVLKKPFFINDTAGNKKFKASALLDDNSFSSVLCVPAIFNRHLLASLVLYSKRPDNYTKEHIRILSALAYQAALAIQNYHLYTNMHSNYFNTIKSLVLAMEAKDPYTKGHSERVTEYALIIANMMGMPPAQVHMIKYCGMLHDLGKIAVSDAVLHKPGPLTVSEKNQIRKHPAAGAAVLTPLTFLRQGISAVKHHHERFDGFGYPDGLKGERIPLTARVLACADAYDAMTSDRPYRPRLSKELAMQELKASSGKQFDPYITNIFLKSLEHAQ